jgi:bisphosphoglycerate-independent phosphoglycerate mutase (AlkP superfamily)
MIREHEPGSIYIEILTPWDSVRHDYITFEMAVEYLKTVRPRVLYIAFGETDDWAHDRRYDRVLEAINYFDGCLRKLWQAIEDSPEYRGRTTVVPTSDHGRGATIEDWHSHSEKVQGADQIWAAILGPDTPAAGEGENASEVFQRDIAPTVIELLGIDYHQYAGVEGKPIAAAVGGK